MWKKNQVLHFPIHDHQCEREHELVRVESGIRRGTSANRTDSRSGLIVNHMQKRRTRWLHGLVLYKVRFDPVTNAKRQTYIGPEVKGEETSARSPPMETINQKTRRQNFQQRTQVILRGVPPPPRRASRFETHAR